MATVSRKIRIAPALGRNIRIRQLQIAVAVADQGSLLQAARALGISQPSVTKTIIGIEKLIGAPIFDRLPRGVVANDLGEAFIATARRIVAEVSRIETDLGLIADGLAGTLAIGALPTAAAGLLPSVVRRYRQIYPGIAVSITDGRTEGLLPHLQAGSLDVVVGRLYETDIRDDFRREVFYNEPLGVIARRGHPILSEPNLTSQKLAPFEFMLPSLSQRLSYDVEKAIEGAGLTIARPLRSTSLTFIREYVADSDTLTILPRMMVMRDVERGTLADVPLRLPDIDRPAGLITPRHRQHSTALKAFHEVLRQYLKTLQSHSRREQAAE